MTSESTLHTWAANYLNLVLPSDAVWTTVVNEGRRGWQAQAMIRRHGMAKGWPDLQIFWRGRTCFVELKSPRGRLSEDQRALHQRLSDAGCFVAVARSLEDLATALASAGIPTMEATPIGIQAQSA